MRKWAAVTIILTILISVAVFFLSKRINPQKISQESEAIPTQLPSPMPSYTIEYQFNNLTYRASWFTANPKSLTLIPNYSEKRTSVEIKEISHCVELVNGGFYDKNGSPIGLVINNNQLINNFQQNLLFNGIFSVDNAGFPKISSEVPQNPLLAIQSGPILIIGGQNVDLNIRDGETARRIVAAITKKEKIIFLSFYKPDNVYEGPLLADLPSHLQKFEQLSKISISDALNLDGGSASVFISDKVTLGELTSVGSFFCTR